MTEALQVTPEMMKAFAAMLAGNAPNGRKRKGKKGKRVASTPELKAERMAANDAECIKVFTAAGYQDVQPRINVLTYGRVKPDGTVTGWIGKGRKVKAGEHGHRVGVFNLFHIDQTSELEAVQ